MALSEHGREIEVEEPLNELIKRGLPQTFHSEVNRVN